MSSIREHGENRPRDSQRGGSRSDPNACRPLRPRRHNARIRLAANPFDSRRGGNPAPLARDAIAQVSRNTINNAPAKVVGKKSGYVGRPPSPAYILNQDSSFRGFSSDSARSEIALAGVTVIPSSAVSRRRRSLRDPVALPPAWTAERP